MGKGFIVTDADIPNDCLHCPLDHGESRAYHAYIKCLYGRIKYCDAFSLHRRPDYCKLKELEDEKDNK